MFQGVQGSNGFLRDEINGNTNPEKTRAFRGKTILEKQGNNGLQGYKETAIIRLHLFDVIFLHPKALFYSPF